MNKGEWTILSNHGRVLAYVTTYSRSTIQVIAQETGLSIAGTQKIITDLVESGYVVRTKVGRCNQYKVDPEKPMRHRLLQSYCVGGVLAAVGCITPEMGANKMRWNQSIPQEVVT